MVVVRTDVRGEFVLPQPARQTDPLGGFHPLTHTKAAVDPSSTPMVRIGQLCTVCASVRDWIAEHSDEIRTAGYQGPDVPHYARVGQLEQSYRDGCHLCTLLWSSLLSGAEKGEPIMTSAAEREKAVKGNLSDLRNGGAVSIRIDRENPYGNHNVYLMPRVAVPQASPTVRGGRTLDGETMDMYSLDLTERPRSAALETSIGTSAFRWARECFETCMTSHPGCRLRSRPALPTRLLQITKLAKGTDGPNLELRLIDTETLHLPARLGYAALSYCWGPGPSFKLETHNEQLLRAGILEQRLPRTIRDAACVTTELGLGYLWVDSLCILQDSPQDWEREASRMCDVYQGSVVTLYAIGAAKNTDGLFSHRDPLVYAACPLLVPDGDGRTPSVMPLNADGSAWPLFGRGWAVQERLLSPRQLRFGPYLEWECAGGRRSEFDVDSGSLDVHRLQNALSAGGPAAAADGGGAAAGTEQSRKLRLLWKAIVDHYSRARLTVQTDRLAAISGIITAMRRGTGQDNVAGVWDPIRAIDLLWETTTAEKLSVPTRPSGLGPSWSWISVDGAVNMAIDASILDDLVTEVVARVNLLPSTPGSSTHAIQISCVAIRNFRAMRDGGQRNVHSSSIDLYLRGCPVRHLMVQLDDWTSITTPTILLVLMIKQSRAYGLALIPSQEVPGAYSRVGVVNEDPILFPSCRCSTRLIARTRKPALRETFVLV